MGKGSGSLLPPSPETASIGQGLNPSAPPPFSEAQLCPPFHETAITDHPVTHRMEKGGRASLAYVTLSPSFLVSMILGS